MIRRDVEHTALHCACLGFTCGLSDERRRHSCAESQTVRLALVLQGYQCSRAYLECSTCNWSCDNGRETRTRRVVNDAGHGETLCEEVLMEMTVCPPRDSASQLQSRIESVIRVDECVTRQRKMFVLEESTLWQSVQQHTSRNPRMSECKLIQRTHSIVSKRSQ